ncbi:MAG TPA: M14 family metallopeptidase [Pelomicrobium sp.]|nr:M14 family metallopeptidase [Pelomicrobium sp.]
MTHAAASATPLIELDRLPEGFLDADAVDLHRVLSGPALIHLPGRREPPLFVSVLQHGDEDVGLRAVQALLRDAGDRPLPRALSIFVGNVQAARLGVRFPEGGADFNRVWPGTDVAGHEDAKALMAAVVERMRARGVFASVDLHNNTGLNPQYACVNRTDPRWLNLAALFSRTVVYFTRPLGVQSLAFSALCPAVTCECGRIGDESGVDHAREFLQACLQLAEIPVQPPHAGDIHVFHTVARVLVPEELAIGFGDCKAAVCFRYDLDHLNFRELAPGTFIGRCSDGVRLHVSDEHGRERWDDYFIVEENEIRLRRAVMPSMFTRKVQAIRQDCLGYLMERWPL